MKRVYTRISILLILCLVCSLVFIQTSDGKAKGISLSCKNIRVKVANQKSVKIKGVKSKLIKSISFKKSNKGITIVKNSKTKFTIVGLKPEITKVGITIKLKKKIFGKKSYKLSLSVTVYDELPLPTMTSDVPTESPTMTPTIQPSSSPFDVEEAKRNLEFEQYNQFDEGIVYRFTNNYDQPFCYNLSLSIYEGDVTIYKGKMVDASFDDPDEEYTCIIAPGETQYRVFELSSGSIRNHQFVEEPLVHPIINDYYRLAKPEDYSLTSAEVDGQYVTNVQCLKQNATVYSSNLMLVYLDGNPYTYGFLTTEASFGETKISKCLIPKPFAKEYNSLTYEVVPINVLIHYDEKISSDSC